jgi:putative hemolysin
LVIDIPTEFFEDIANTTFNGKVTEEEIKAIIKEGTEGGEVQKSSKIS